MQTVTDDILSLTSAVGDLRQISDEAASRRPAPGKWSKKEILGHLIDSATNNHQRFVRLQLGGNLELPGYTQDDWVRVQGYQDRPWHEIIDFWQAYNKHLAEVIRSVDPNTLRNVWHAPNGSDVDLEFIMRDYVVHMRHHLEQIL
jgi:hypothetical protein